jgi:MFS transporter, ACS family, hexuronate transporter
MNGDANGPEVAPILESPGEARVPRSVRHRRAYGGRLRGAAWTWLPTLSMMLATLVSFIDRNTLALLAPSILRDTGLSAQEYGLIVSAFSIAYVAGNLFWGRLLDRSGVLWVMAAAVALWSAASAAHALASGLLGFAAARTLLGFAEGATFPGAMRTVVQTLPPSSRSRGIGVAYSGASLGFLAAPLLVTPIALSWGWRAAFWATGGIGLLWLLTWLLQRRRAELSAPPQQDRGPREDGLRWTDCRLGSFVGIYATGALPIYFVLYVAPLYLGQGLGMSQSDLGRLLWIPSLGGEVGLFFWGWVTDRHTAHGGSLSALRRLFAALAVLSLPLAFAGRLGGPALVLGALSFAMFVGGGFIVAALAYGTNAFPTARLGLLAGLASGSLSLLTAVTMPLFGRLFDGRCYDAAFAVAAAVPLVGFAAWWVLNTSPHREQNGQPGAKAGDLSALPRDRCCLDSSRTSRSEGE